MTGGPAVARAEMLLSREVSEERRADAVGELVRRGYEVRDRRVLAHRGPAELQWAVLVALPLHAFLTGLGTEAVKDAYEGLRRLAGRAVHRGGADDERPGADGPDGADEGRPLVLQDERTGLRIVLEADLPRAAYEQLLGLELSRFRHGPLHYDRARRRWRSELDEAAGRDDAGPSTA
ncbi:hypothetical protein DEH18_15610 [Streptomyces sp. NHF165]|uniref:hypothetical protein n=1 Tax=Streptomyces sp. NHF165 TaxID=2175864 RepID=UPI00132F3AF0|nr:hypothetical protein [Streptomyces sp. NHF165]QHF95050.1 hypothetical protein DEH18_15610 [Streptomyces sp. NHF165]